MNLCVCWVAHLFDETLSSFHGFLSLTGIGAMPLRKKGEGIIIDIKDSQSANKNKPPQQRLHRSATTVWIPFQTNIILFLPWSRMKHSSESRSLWRNGFSSLTMVTFIDPDASDTWQQTAQMIKVLDVQCS